MAKYSGQLMPVAAGQVITVSAKSLAHADRCDINLGSDNDADIVFHMSIRFAGSGEMVRNALTRGVGWGHEERHENLISQNVANPIRRGAEFKVAIFVDSSMFYISIDDKPYCLFPHRRPLHEIKQITVTKDVETIYQVDHVTSQQSRWPEINTSCFSNLAPRPFRAGHVIVVKAVPLGNRGNFIIDFNEGSNLRVLFHLRVYFENGTIVLNDQEANGNWRSQVTSSPSPFPFNIGQHFKLAIAMTNNDFVIAANGRRISSFPYREGNHKVFGSATGFTISSNNGLKLDVKGVDYFTSDVNASDLERLCKP